VATHADGVAGASQTSTARGGRGLNRRRPLASRACVARLRLARRVLPPRLPCPVRAGAPENVHPQKAKVAGPVPRGCAWGGGQQGHRRVGSGGRGRPKRPSRLPRTALTRRASSARSQPRRTASPERLSVAGPCSRGCTAVSHHRASPSCQETCPPPGASPAPHLRQDKL
jgi:hypothetical protein